MADAFARFYAAFNTEWPQYGMTPEEAQTQERRWRHALSDFSTDALAYAMTELVRTAKKRPKASEVVEFAQAFSRARSGLKPMKAAQPDHLCSCGCLGVKWLRVMRDNQTGDVRRFAENPADYLANVGVVFTPYQRKLFEQLQGEPLTRIYQRCNKSGNAPLPDEAYRVGYEGQMPVYDVPVLTGD